MNSSHTEDEGTTLVLAYLESRNGDLGPVDTTVEFEALPPVMKVKLVDHWIDQLRVLYCFVREEAEGEVDLEEWDFFKDLKAHQEIVH